MPEQWNDKVFGVNKEHFEELALGIFRFQYDNSPVYKAYADALQIDPAHVNRLDKIPFLPIRFFKSHSVQTTSFEPQAIFESSGTTGSTKSRHLIKDLYLYEESFIKGFELFYGPVKECCVIGLLPSYLEHKNSSLVYMVDKLITRSEHPQSDFYLDEYEKIYTVMNELEKRGQKTLLVGVTFALLDLAEKFPLALKYTTIMETGGMKGRKVEMIREEVHKILRKEFNVSTIHSEYGMTELLSQAYSKEAGIFYCPPWMKVMVRDEEDPLRVRHLESNLASLRNPGGVRHLTGAINIIDFANIYSCSFIATDDAGKLYPDGSFEVLGRMDNSDLRGCSLMAI